MYKLDLYIGDKKTDLFGDESINISSSVQNINDISKIFTDFSTEFTVPASQVNNIIFSHWYNVDIFGGFDARIRVDATLELSSLPFKKGTIRLLEVAMQDGKPVDYKIQFFGLLTSLKDTFKDDYISGLDFSPYDHEYNYTNVNTGVSTGLFSGDIIYPLISSVKRWYYSSDTSDDTNTDSDVNIAFESATDKGILWSELKPALKVMRIVEAIETKYGVTFSRDFIGNSAFDNLFMWLAVEKGYLNNASTESPVDFTSQTVGNSGYLNLVTDEWSDNITRPTSTSQQVYSFTFGITPDTGFESVKYNMYIRDSLQQGMSIAQKTDVSGVQTITGEIRLADGEFFREFTNKMFVSANAPFTYISSITIEKVLEDTVSGDTSQGSDVYVAAVNSVTSTLNISNFVPKIKVIDFFNGLIKMFNLAVIPNSATSFFVDNLESWYNAGNTYDITKYVEFKNKIPVKRVPIPSLISLKFQEPSTFLAKTYEDLNNTSYGDLELVLDDGSGNVFDGSTLEISLPFENMVYERLRDDNDDSLSNIQYGFAVDQERAPSLTKPHLFYAINQDTTSSPFGLLNDAATPVQKNSAFMPFHGNVNSNPDYTTVWGGALNEWDGTLFNSSLYNNYYVKYITDLFSQKRRLYNFEAILPIQLLSVLKLNDKLIIKDVAFIINNIDSNLTSGKIELELLNNIGSIVGAPRDIYFQYDL